MNILGQCNCVTVPIMEPMRGAFSKFIFQGFSASECLCTMQSVSAAIIEPFCKVRRAKLIYIHKCPTTNAAVVQQSSERLYSTNEVASLVKQ